MRPYTLLFLDDSSGLPGSGVLGWGFIGISFIIAVLLGYMHEGRLFMDCLTPLVVQFKREYRELRASWLRLRRELTTWDTEE